MNFKILDDAGKEIECELLYTFRDDTKNISYIIYTDGEKNDNGELEIYASRYELEEGNYILKAIENDTEWDLIDSFLASNMKM